jgi:hypothetical protein
VTPHLHFLYQHHAVEGEPGIFTSTPSESLEKLTTVVYNGPIEVGRVIEKNCNFFTERRCLWCSHHGYNIILCPVLPSVVEGYWSLLQPSIV